MEKQVFTPLLDSYALNQAASINRGNGNSMERPPGTQVAGFKFPEGFFWGSATSAHQVEGWNNNDWSVWEQLNAKRLALNAKSKSWPDFILNSPAGGPNPLQEENYISGRACDHYNRFREDFDIAKSLGHNAHRFSIEWSRVEPEEGKWDEKEIEHYREVIKALRERGLEPFVTLWHWTLPKWLAGSGGIRHKNFAGYFERYAAKMAEMAGPDVRYWFTVNEPEIYALNSYFRGRWTPGKHGIFNFYLAMRSLIKAHKAAYRAIKKAAPMSMAGVVCNLSDFMSSDGIVNVFLKAIVERSWNHYFLRKVKNHFDCIGLNFYFHNRINYGFNKNKNEIMSDVGWDLHPQGIENVLTGLVVYGKPIFITESGLADSRDKYRVWFIAETLKAVERAIKRGANVRGYLHWSLLDNFEWDKGFWPRFGLVEVDYKTLDRKIRPSAYEYAKLAKANAIDL